ncbi:sucrose/H+ symporter [Salinivirga cyanobacteriivorans]|uniref:Sucrose/H+ symporter n=1 Tax=Salinivirga cyanobacteriivorans TaxID=1307839 RepID=A0A0S2I2B7_9BACT|nr:MFS transporter [Salinivirga cyanobacteriivorans]ALO16399.1 sucrose/H+ symporter [Salinivirga cyanobacteriivorans]
MKQKPKLSFWQIWNMSFGFLGIQFGFALQNANVSRIFETLGANIDNIPILWIAAPVTGLIVQPIIGHWSDKTWCRLGRRRPFFLIGAILASLALLVMPNSPVLWVAAGMLWIMDASINISMEPFRAFVGDNLPSSQRTTGFAMQSFFIGTGAVIASLLPYMMTNWFGFSNTAPEGVIPDSVKFSFYVGGAVFFLAVLWTVIRSKEYSPEELKEFEDHSEDVCEDDHAEAGPAIKVSLRTGIISFLFGGLLSLLFVYVHVEKEVFILSFGLMAFGLLEALSALLQHRKVRNGYTSIFNDLNNMPLTMKQLAVVQFFSWFALFAMWIYTTNGVTADKYDMEVDQNMVKFLSTQLDELENKDKINSGRATEIREELKKYRAHLNNDEKASAKVNLVKFYLSDHILKEKEVVETLQNQFESARNKSGDERIASVLKELERQEKSKTPDIPYEALKQVNQLAGEGLVTLPQNMDGKFTFFTRLKEIRKNYNDGADWVGVGFGVYNGFAAVFAFFLMFLSRITTRKITHMISLLVGGLSYLAVFWIQDTSWLLLLPFVGIGLAWASILAIPYAILTGSLPQNKMGVYMGIFNFFLVIPQILAASLLGFMVKFWFDEKAIYALVLGGIALLLAAVSVLFVKDED